MKDDWENNETFGWKMIHSIQIYWPRAAEHTVEIKIKVGFKVIIFEKFCWILRRFQPLWLHLHWVLYILTTTDK